MFFSRSAHTTTPDLSPDYTPLVGRQFILGHPNALGHFSVFLEGVLWRITAGAYIAGDRVSITSVDQDRLWVQRI